MSDSTIKMRSSHVLKKMRDGGVATCVKLNLSDPVSAELAGLCGFDSIWVDMEHLPHTDEQIHNHIRAAKMQNIDTIVRVKRGSYSDLIHPFEMDATAIMVPHLMNLREAKEIVYYTKFHPIGRRPWDGGYSDGAYCMIPCDEYSKQSNEQRFVIVQIEDPEPLDELEDIAQLPGIDMLFFGPGDFSQGIGVPGESDNPKIADTRKLIAEVARKHGKFAGTTGSVASFEGLVNMGYQFLSIGADVVGLGQYYSDIISAVKGIEQTTLESIYKGK